MTTDEADGKTGLKTVFNVCCRASTLSNTKIQKKENICKNETDCFSLIFEILHLRYNL